jgi:acyl transferase domain-containing protein
MALAGGVSITVPVKSGYLHQEGAMLSPDGRTRTFDADAQGTVFSDGAAMVLLKRLEDAKRDGDTIYGVIRGGAINNDGGGKASFTAPSIEGQAAVIAMAHVDAGVEPREIGYVEAHGTATPLGDPIEVEALTRAFRLRTKDTSFCAIGSVKSNVGHLVIAAGATGLIKTALALTHEVIPPSLHFDRPNPKIDFAASPFRVAAKPAPWPRGNARRLAGVSSFGVGGTNAHVVVEEAPLPSPNAASRDKHVLFLSARSEATLASASVRLADHLERAPESELPDIAFTLHAGRKAFAHRRAIVAASAKEAADALRMDPKRSITRKALAPAPHVVFMFPGQGAQYPSMGAALYRDQALFRAEVDTCAEELAPILGRDLRSLVFAAGDDVEAARALKQTSITQPALFVIEYALAKLWLSFGVRPTAMIGHSVGEFVCATLAGVMDRRDALRLVAERGQRMQSMLPGSMLSVRLPAEQIETRLGPTLAIASDMVPRSASWPGRATTSRPSRARSRPKARCIVSSRRRTRFIRR